MQHAASRVQHPSDVFAFQLLLRIELICNQRILSNKPGRNFTRVPYPACVFSLRLQTTIRKSDMTGGAKILVYAKGQDQADHVLGIIQEVNEDIIPQLLLLCLGESRKILLPPVLAFNSRTSHPQGCAKISFCVLSVLLVPSALIQRYPCQIASQNCPCH